MNRIALFAAACLAAAVLMASPAGAQQSAKQVYQEAMTLYNAKNFEAALPKFLIVQKAYPQDIRIRAAIAACRMEIKEGRGNPFTLEAQLRQIMVPDVEFEATSLANVFEFLRQKSAELSGGKVNLNVLYYGTPEQLNAGTVTLKAKNLSMSELIRHIGEQTRTQFSYDSKSVIGKPRSNVAEQEPTPAEPKAADPFAKNPFA